MAATQRAIHTLITGNPDAVNSVTVAAFTPTAGDLLVAILSVRVDLTTNPTISDGNSLTWTLQIEDAVNARNVWVWTAPVTGTPGSATVVFDWTGETASEAGAAVVEVQGTDQGVGNVASNFHTGAAKLLTNTITTLESDGLLIVAQGAGDAEGTATPTGFTQRASIDTGGISGSRVGLVVKDVASTGAAQNHTWGDNTVFVTNRNLVAIEVQVAAGGAGILSQMLQNGLYAGSTR